MPPSPLLLPSSRPQLEVRYIILPPGPLPPLNRLHARGTPSRSFVIGFLLAIWTQACQTGMPFVDILGASKTSVLNTANLAANAPLGLTTKGIVVGAGTLPPTPSDYALGNLILHGVAPGQLSYAACTFVDPYIVGDIVYAGISRIILNSSGGSIYIAEIGLYQSLRDTATANNLMTARDLLASTITMPTGTSKQFIYTFATET